MSEPKRKKMSKARREEIRGRWMRYNALKKSFEMKESGGLKDADKEKLKSVVGTAITKYVNELIKTKRPEKEKKELLNKIRPELKLKKGGLSVQKVREAVSKINLNDEDVLRIVSSFLGIRELQGDTIDVWSSIDNIPKVAYTRLNKEINKNSTKVKDAGKSGETTYQETLDESLGKWETGSLLNLIEYILSTKPEDIQPNRIGQLTEPQWQRYSEMAKDRLADPPKIDLGKKEEESSEEDEPPTRKDKTIKKTKPAEKPSSEEEEAIDIEVEVPVSPEKGKLSDIQKLREAEKRKPEGEKQEGNKPEKGKLSDLGKLREAEKQKAKPERGSLKAMKRLQEERQRSIAFKKVLDVLATNKEAQEKVKSQNIHIQNEIQKKLPALANSITDQQRHNIATIIQMKAMRAKAMGRGLELRNAINDATLRVTGKSINQLKREEPITGQVKRFVGATQRKGSDVSKEEEEFAELSTNLLSRLGGKQPEEINAILSEVSADESDPMSDFARVYYDNMDFIAQEDTPSEISQSDLTVSSSEISQSDLTVSSSEESDIELPSSVEPPSGSEYTIEEFSESETETKPITTKGGKKPSIFGPKLLKVDPTDPSGPSGVATKKIKVPEDWSENKQAKGTLRPKFISPSVNVLQPSEQDIQADFDEWAIFDFVQPVNNYGAEGNNENNPLKRMARVEEETRYRNAGMDLDPSLASVYTNREINTSNEAMAMDMLPPLMPDTSSQPRQVYDVSEYEVKSYDVNNDRTQIEYQSPYDNMTPIVLTNDEIRRSVLYGRVP